VLGVVPVDVVTAGVELDGAVDTGIAAGMTGGAVLVGVLIAGTHGIGVPSGSDVVEPGAPMLCAPDPVDGVVAPALDVSVRAVRIGSVGLAFPGACD